MNEAVRLLKPGGRGGRDEVGKNCITSFIHRHPDLVTRFSCRMDKKRLDTSNLTIIHSHQPIFRGGERHILILQAIRVVLMRRDLDRGYQTVIVKWRERSMPAKVATDAKRELILVIESMSEMGNYCLR